MSTGTVATAFDQIGSNLPGYDNYFCRDCRRIVHVQKGSPGFRACPTPGCTRPTGFGVYAKVPRREPPFAFRPPEGFARRRGPVLTAWVARGVAGGNFLSPFLSGQGLIRDIGV